MDVGKEDAKNGGFAIRKNLLELRSIGRKILVVPARNRRFYGARWSIIY